MKRLDKVSNYWVNKDPFFVKYTCPNVTLFRFLGYLIDSIEGKKVLEIGFNNGADLLECKKRGADIYGTDINPLAISKVELDDKTKVKTSRCGVDPIPFSVEFDLIYSRDTICYLSDDEIKFFIYNASKNIKEGGILLIQFIESDLKVEIQDPLDAVNFIAFHKAELKTIFTKDNPIRFLSSRDLIREAESVDLNLVGSKRVLQSYDLQEERFRLDRYLAFRKINCCNT